MKPFDQLLYDQNDTKGKQAVKRWLASRGCKAEDFFQYDVDLIVKRGNRWVCFVEVEVRSWDECKYNTIHIAQRKAKMLDNSMPTYVFVCGNNLQIGYYCNATSVLTSEIINLPNKYEKKELFYDVPISKFTKIRLKENLSSFDNQ